VEFAELITPTDPRFMDFARQVHAGRQDVREAFPDFNGVDFRKWLAVNGVREYPDQLAQFYPSVPPDTLRRIACGGSTEHSHLYTSVDDFRTVTELWTVFADRPIRAIHSVYDFGCGCGRLMRWFSMALPELTCRGSDVQPNSIEWCQQNLRGDYFVNAIHPPLALPDRCVDLVVALSVFSHLRLKSNLAWIHELARVCRPDGLILLSTHGAFALALLHRSDEHQRDLHITASEARTSLRNLSQKEFIYHRLAASNLPGADGVEDDYGQAFFTEPFARKQWAQAVDVLGCVPAALSATQDMYVLQPRAG